jgi:hypothetical protein
VVAGRRSRAVQDHRRRRELGADPGGGEYTGVNELHLDPRDPDVMYAVTHQRYRNVAALINGGPESGIHKSTDGGDVARADHRLPTEDMGKIGLAVSPIDPDIVYATVELAHRKGGFYRSTDGGESWTKRNDYISGGTGPHYYQEIFACPHKLDRVYQMDVRLHVTEDGGTTFRSHRRARTSTLTTTPRLRSRDPNYLLVRHRRRHLRELGPRRLWKYVANLPVTQFYKVASTTTSRSTTSSAARRTTPPSTARRAPTTSTASATRTG